MTNATKFLAGALLAGCVGAAHALPVTLSDTRTFNQSVSQSQPFTYQHTNPFDVSLYDFVSATLTLTMTGAGSNSYFISFGSDAPLAYVPGVSPSASSSFFDTAWTSLLSLTLSVQGTTGNPRLTQSVLTITASLRDTGGNGDNGGGDNGGGDNGPGNDDPDPLQTVPEPGTLALLGLALLGGLFTRRRTA